MRPPSLERNRAVRRIVNRRRAWRCGAAGSIDRMPRPPPVAERLRPAQGRARRPHHARPRRDRPQDRDGPRARRPLRERRLPRRQGRAGEDGGPHPPARGAARRRRDRRGRRAPTDVAAGRWSSIRYEGDDDVERYLIGSIEERHDDVEVDLPGLAARPGAHRRAGRRRRRVRGPGGHRSRSRSSPSSRRRRRP